MSSRSFRSFLRPLAWLMFCAWLSVAPLALAQGDDAAADDPIVQLAQAGKDLKQIQAALDSADTPDTLKTLSDRALAVQRDADAARNALQPQLEQVDARVAQLGEVAEGTTEARDITAQRKALNQQRSDLASAIARAKLLAGDAKQVGADIEKMRVTQFSEDLARKVNSPLSPSLWKQFAVHVPADYSRLVVLYRLGETAARKAIAEHGWGAPLTGLALALLMFFPLRLWLRAVGRRYAASERAPDGRLRRSGLAVWLLAVGTLLPGFAAVVLVAALDSIGAIPPRLEQLALHFQVATFVAAFITALSACLLVPKRPSWRLLSLDDSAAWRLRKYAWGAAGLTFLSILLVEINRASRTSEITTVAVDGLIAITYMALIVAILVSLARLHRRQTDEAQAKLDAQVDAGAKQPKAPVRKSGWIVLARLAGHVVVAAAVIATLLGYLNLALFVAQQLVWGAVVLLAASLLLKFADDLSLWLLSPTSRVGKSIVLTTGLNDAKVEQAGVLLSAVLRIGVILLAVLALTAPFGNLNTFFSAMDSLSNGLTIGTTTLKPSSVLYAVLAFLVVWAVMQAFQNWLTNTYLPKTDLDAGARNSISTVTRYLGIIAAVLWGLTALGIGFEKLALVVSALSVGIGFGLQAITQNFVSGLILLAERPVKIGDWVKLGDQEGDIKRISVRSTEIQVGDKSTLIVPNSELITKTIRNMTMGNAQGRIQIQFAVPLSTDVAAVRQILLDCYSEHVGVLAEPAPSVFIDSIANGQVAINSFAYVSGPRAVYGVRSDLYFTMLQKFAAAHIALSSPTDIHLVRDPAAPQE
ncbi:Ion channel protein [Stenotrophomonas rhizophila]|nr:Ion channel protein [Stenotrophomonas rhizophila]